MSRRAERGKDPAGFTVLEMIVVCGLLALFMSTGAAVLVKWHQEMRDHGARLERQLRAARALERLVRDVRRSAEARRRGNTLLLRGAGGAPTRWRLTETGLERLAGGSRRRYRLGPLRWRLAVETETGGRPFVEVALLLREENRQPVLLYRAASCRLEEPEP